jgi:hypothetical protein
MAVSAGTKLEAPQRVLPTGSTASALAEGVTAGSSGAVASYSSMAALKAADTSSLSTGDTVFLSSYYGYPTTKADGGEGTFMWSATATGTGNDGTFVVPTANPTTGRFIRLGIQDEFYVNWYGALGNGLTASATANGAAIDAAILDAGSSKPSSRFINAVVFKGEYFTDRNHVFDRTLVRLKGSGALNSRLSHTSTASAGPVIYMNGGFRATAAPYGGIEGMSFGGEANTFPAIVYIDDVIDNLFKLNDVGFGGGAAGCDGLSFYDYLNAHANTIRFDRNSGYAMRIRGTSAGYLGASGTGAGNIYRNLIPNTTTGLWTVSAGDPQILKGSGVALWTTNTLPTDPLTGVALKGGTAAAGAGLYFAGPWNTTTYGTTLHRTLADAIAGINPIIPSDVGVGQHAWLTVPTICPVSAVDTSADTIAYTNRTNTIVAGSTWDNPALNPSATTPVIGTGFTATGTIAWAQGASRIGILYGDGTPPSGITYGTPYYFIYNAYNKVKIAATMADALAGTAIDLGAGFTGNMWIAYNHNTSSQGVGSFEINQMTYDNASATTVETVNGVACGGYGLLFYNQLGLTKGPISIKGHRIEINKLPARDLVFGDGMRAMIRGFATQASNSSYYAPSVLFSIEGLQFDIATSLLAHSKTLLGVACNANVDIAPSFKNCLFFGFGGIYNNESGNAFSAVGGNGSRTWIEDISGFIEDKVSGKKATNSQFNVTGGINQQRVSQSNLATSCMKIGDMFHSDDTGAAMYKQMGTVKGFGVGTGATSIGATVTGTVGSNVFTLSATPTDTYFCTGAAVSIAGAGAASAALTGVVGVVDVTSATKTFRLHVDTDGSAQNCVTAVAGAAVTYQAQVTASVPVVYRGSGTVNPGLIAGGAQVDVDIAAPTGVTLPAGREVSIGLSASPTAGVIYGNARVKSGGAFVTITVCNFTGGNVTPGSLTVRYAVIA